MPRRSAGAAEHNFPRGSRTAAPAPSTAGQDGPRAGALRGPLPSAARRSPRGAECGPNAKRGGPEPGGQRPPPQGPAEGGRGAVGPGRPYLRRKARRACRAGQGRAGRSALRPPAPWCPRRPRRHRETPLRAAPLRNPRIASGSATKSAEGGRALWRPAHARARFGPRLPARAHGSRRGQRQISRGAKLCACAALRGGARRLCRPLPLKGDAPASPAPPEAALFRRPVPRNAAVLCRSDRRRSPRARAGPHDGTPPAHEQPPNARPLDAGRRSLPASPRSREARIHPRQRPARQLCSLPLLHVRFSQGMLTPPAARRCPALAARSVHFAVRGSSPRPGIHALHRSHGTPR